MATRAAVRAQWKHHEPRRRAMHLRHHVPRKLSAVMRCTEIGYLRLRIPALSSWSRPSSRRPVGCGAPPEPNCVH